MFSSFRFKYFFIKIDQTRLSAETGRRILLQLSVLQARSLFSTVEWGPEVSLVHSVARRSMVAAHKCTAGCPALLRFATRYDRRSPTRKIVVDRWTISTTYLGSILFPSCNNLICLLLWECYVGIGGRFLSGPVAF